MTVKKKNFRAALAILSEIVLSAMGCRELTLPQAENASSSHIQIGEGTVVATSHGSLPARGNYEFTVPEDVRSVLKMKCYICHGGNETNGGFDLKQMIYQEDAAAAWQPMDLAGATRIKLAILPIDGKKPRMPKRAGSILNPLTVEEANLVAKWTDYPFQQ